MFLGSQGVMLPVTATIFFALVAISLPAEAIFENHAALSRLFDPTKAGAITYYRAAKVGPPICPSNTTMFESVRPHENVQKSFVVRHNEMLLDGIRCGSNGTENSTLWIVPSTYVQDNKSASLAGTTAVYNALFGNTRARGAFQNLIAVDPVFVGVELMSDRICGDTVRWRKNSVFLFIQAEGKVLDFSSYGWINEGENAILSYAPPVGSNLSTLCVYKNSINPGPNISPFITPSPSPNPNVTVSPSPTASASATPSPSVTEDKPSKDKSCFPASAIVELESGKLVKMKGLKIGDRVRVGPSQFSTVIMFTHKDTRPVSQFVRVKTKSHHSISLSPGHYLHVKEGLKAAESVQIGDVLTLSDGSCSPVVAVDYVTSSGLFNPQTIDGRIVVDGVLASTYTTAIHPTLAHVLLAPVRFLFRLGLAPRLRVFHRNNYGLAKLLDYGSPSYI